MSRTLLCYLRTHRRRWALTQPELARLLGFKSAQHISRVENGQENLGVHALFGCEIIFGNHPKDIFPKLYDEIEQEIVRNVYELQQELEADTSEKGKLKQALFTEALARALMSSKQESEYES